ncbi:AMP-binding protein [Sphingomonas sp. MMSM20]|uniref:AMP-binding protein n=1 Tax=Sphingomonas lycopersici TaxID=2951807 RepID=UPI0022379DFB|nr:AMP-binding protein [Sphingomonas lycopersici]
MAGRGRAPPLFAATLQQWGAAPALVCEDGRSISFDQLAGLADDFAAALPDEILLLAVEARNRVEAVVAYLGALRSGTPVIMHHEAAAAGHILDHYRPDARYLLDEASGAWRLEATPAAWELEPHPDLALLLSTSGSTGSPKLVRLSANALDANARSIAAYLGLTAADRAVTSLPLSYSYGLSVVNSHLTVGGSIVLTEASVADATFRDMLHTHGVTGLAGVPHSYELMDRAGLLADLPVSLTTLTQAGGRMAPDLVARIAGQVRDSEARLFIMYGQTEATARIAYLPPEQLTLHPGAIGRAIPGGELWLENGQGARVAAGEPGELVYRGPNVMMGYATARRDMADPPGPDVLRTGDLAIEIEPGLFRIVGRKSRFVKAYGLRVGLDDLEERCRAAGAATCCVAGDDALVVVAAAATADLDKARQALGGLDLPATLFEFVEFAALPRTQRGKIDYAAVLRAGHAARERLLLADGSAIERVARLYRGLAHGMPIAETDSFESLGGDSLSYVQCSIAIEDALGALPEGWETLSLAQLRARAQTDAPRHAHWHLIWLESDIIVRCLAIMLILFQHALGGMQGGADVLMMLAGFTWARFQRTRLLAGRSGAVFLDFARRYLLIYLAIMLVVFAHDRHILWRHQLFVSTFHGDWGGILNPYWFIESLTWCVAVTCILLAIPAVRRFATLRPTGFGMAFAGAALMIHLIGGRVGDAAGHAFRSPDQTLVYFATGWAIAQAGRPLRLALFLMLATVSALAWGWNDAHVAAMLVAAGLIVFVRRIPLPDIAGRMMIMIAAASFYIYIFNIFPMYVTDTVLHAKFGEFWVAQIVASLALGIGAYLILPRARMVHDLIRKRVTLPYGLTSHI